MTEESKLNFRDRIALQLYLLDRDNGRVAYNGSPYTEADMAPDDQGGFFRDQDGQFKDYYQYLYLPAHRRWLEQAHPDQTARENRTTWGHWAQNAVGGEDWNDGPIPTGPEPDGFVAPVVPRFRCITSNTEFAIRHYKKESDEILDALLKS